MLRKAKAAIEWCLKNGYVYKMKDPDQFSYIEVFKMYNNKEIDFTQHTKNKIIIFIEKNYKKLNMTLELKNDYINKIHNDSNN